MWLRTAVRRKHSSSCTEILTLVVDACRQGRERRRLAPGPPLRSISRSDQKAGLPANAA